jgi:eukaryotic-like serine/threonine-protein kinase
VWVTTRPEPGAVARFVLTPAPDAHMSAGATWRQLAIAPDGSVAYGASDGIYLRRAGEVDPLPVRGTESGRGPFFSPDGRSLGFFTSNGALSQVSVFGGVPSPVLKAGPAETPGSDRDDFGGASWGPHDVIVLGSDEKGLSRVSVTEGTQEPLTQVGAEGESHRWPFVLPNGRGVLFTVWTGDPDTARIAVWSRETGQVTDLVRGGTSPSYSPTGHLVYAAGGRLRAVGFDAERMTVTSDATPVVENVFVTSNGAAYYGIADIGSLVYYHTSTEFAGASTLALVDSAGQAQALGVPGGRAGYDYPRVSPEGDRVAYMTKYTEGDDITLYEIGTDSAPLRLTFGGGNRYPVWSADGRRVMFQSARDGAAGIFSQSIDGADPAERLTAPSEGERHIPDSASSDGRWLSFTVVRDQVSEVWLLALASRDAKPLVVAPGARVAQSVFSPNAQWLAYQSTETGEDEIFVQPFPPTGAKYQLPSSSDNHHPLWAPDGRSLFYVPGALRFARVSVETTPTFRFGNPVSLNLNRAGRTGPPTQLRRLDIMPDGERFVGVWPDDLVGASPEITDRRVILVLNWHEELKRLVP